MSRTAHLIKRFQTTMGESWWWRRFADLVDRKNEDGTYRPFDAKTARQMLMTRRNMRKYAAQIKSGQPIMVLQPYRARPANSVPTEVPMLERPEGMTRQTQRRLYREACKLAGAPFTRAHAKPPEFMQAMGYKKYPRSWRGMPEWQRRVEEDKLWAEYSSKYIRITDLQGPQEQLTPIDL